MSVTQNAYADMPENTTITEQAASFIETVFDDIQGGADNWQTLYH